MNRRKDELRVLFGGTPKDGEPGLAPERKSATAGAGEEGAKPAVEPASPPASILTQVPSGSGAVRAMGLQLVALKAEAEEARVLRTSVARGERVVEIDPWLIDPAFLSDRLAMDEPGDKSFAALKEAIRRDGQQVPVLLRLHPDAVKAAEGRYQSAYGHRRILAARELGLPVRAILRRCRDRALDGRDAGGRATRRAVLSSARDVGGSSRRGCDPSQNRTPSRALTPWSCASEPICPP